MSKHQIFGCGGAVNGAMAACMLLANLMTLSAAEPTAVKVIVVPAPDAAAGGWPMADLCIYFAESDLRGKPAFTRRERTRRFPLDAICHRRFTGRAVPQFPGATISACV